jgi:cytidine deaminase
MTSPEQLVAAAVAAAHNAYAPYSRFHVGAALLLDDGRVVTGANVENASYGLSLCAETVALAKAANDGAIARIVAVAVAGGPVAADGGATLGPDAVTPCGRCRQMLNESAALSGRDLLVHFAHAGGHETMALSVLLPRAFGPDALPTHLGKEGQ